MLCLYCVQRYTLYHAEGRCIPQAGNTWRYEYNIKDHLSNTRVTFADLDNSGTVITLEILQQNHYYPFGANIEGLTSGSAPAPPPNRAHYNAFGMEMGGNLLRNIHAKAIGVFKPYGLVRAGILHVRLKHA